MTHGRCQSAHIADLGRLLEELRGMDRYMDCSGDCLDCLGDRRVYVPGCGEIELCILIQAMATGIDTLLRELEDDRRSWAPMR